MDDEGHPRIRSVAVNAPRSREEVGCSVTLLHYVNDDDRQASADSRWLSETSLKTGHSKFI